MNLKENSEFDFKSKEKINKSKGVLYEINSIYIIIFITTLYGVTFDEATRILIKKLYWSMNNIVN